MAITDYQQLIQIGRKDQSRIDVSETEHPGPEVLYEWSKERGDFLPVLFLFLSFFTTFTVILLKQNALFQKITEMVPESGCLMVVGVLVTLILKQIPIFDSNDDGGALLTLDARLIEHIMIAPIILHAAYGLYNKLFFRQAGVIMIYAFIATILNSVIITGMLKGGIHLVDWAMDGSYTGAGMGIFVCLTYAALIAAVDPVAVLAVFDAVNADRGLYFLVFGESLLNDGVSFVLFDGLKAFTHISGSEISNIPISSYLFLFGSFITKPVGGILFGYLVGMSSAFVTKYCTERSAFVLPLMNILFAALAYILAIMFNFSGILCLIAFGLCQERYTFKNVPPLVRKNTHNLVSGLAVSMETLLFFFLGTEFAIIKWTKIWIFAIIVLFSIYVARTVVTFFLTFLINQYQHRDFKINWKWQLLIIVGGLRGAIAFAMVLHYNGPYYRKFYDTTVITIFITTLVNGVVAKPLVLMFRLKAKDAVDDKHEEDDLVEKGAVLKTFLKYEKKFIFPYFSSIEKKVKDGE